MRSCDELLCSLAERYGVFLSDLKYNPHLRRKAIRALEQMNPSQAQRPAWLEAMGYLND